MKQSNKTNYLPVFEKTGYVHPATYHFLRTDKIPSVRSFFKIDIRKLFDRLIKDYSLPKEKIIKYDIHSNVIEKSRLQSAYITLTNSITVSLSTIRSEAEIYYDDSTKISEFKKIESIILEHFRKVEEEKKISLIVTDSAGSLDVREFSIADLNENISALYNDDFLKFNSQLIEKLGHRSSQGLVLLHGIPGSGKSSYIRHLIGQVKKDFIYLPSNMADHVAQPNFINFLTRHPNSILIIEDAEEVLMQRKSGARSSVANLLNLSDGLLSDCLKIQVIATFNTDIAKIDEAFLRKGRILGRFCMEPLCMEKTNNLLRQLESKHVSDRAMTLAEIFNHQEPEYGNKKNRTELGFVINGKENKN